MTEPDVSAELAPATAGDPPRDDASEPPVTPRRRAWRTRVLAVIATLLLVASVATAVVQMGRAEDAHADLDRYQDARRAASSFGSAYLTYDASDVTASSERVLALTTDAFAQDFEETRSPGIEALFDEIGTSTRATTTQVFLTEISQGRASALVVVDVEASSTETPDQTLVDLTFVVDLILDGDEWKVDAVTPAPRPDVVGEPGTTTTTAAPSP